MKARNAYKINRKKLAAASALSKLRPDYVSDIALSGGCYGCITPARKVVKDVARDHFSRGVIHP